MKILATVLLAIVVCITAYLALLCSICAVSSSFSARDRWTFVATDLIDIAIMVGSLMLIAKLNKKKKPL